MPAKSLRTHVLKWPDRAAIDEAARHWAGQTAAANPRMLRAGYFGSYARGDYGVGSDLDLLVVVDHDEEWFARRPVRWDLTALPVPAEILVYTTEEWDRVRASGRFGQTLERETVWVYERA